MLYGRDAERSRIGELLEGARAAKSGVLVLRGEPGVGKSALLEYAREHARGMSLLSCRGVESEAQLPFASVHELVRPVLDLADDLPPPQAAALRRALGLAAGGRDDRFLVSLGVLSLLAEAAERQPLLCLIDDAHWLDDASAEALAFVARRLDAEGIVMLFAAREGEPRQFDAPALPELRLEGIDSEAADALLARHVRVELSPAVRDRLLVETGGNPLALIELSSTLSEVELSGAEPVLVPLPLGTRLEGAYLTRVRRLPEETQTLLLVAAADDSGELSTVLAAAAQLDVPAEALDAAELDGLLAVRGARLDFRHPLVRSAVYQGSTLSSRQAAHRALAHVLTGEEAADRRAWHLAAATVEPDPAVVEELEQAAERAHLRSGFTAAASALERAAELTQDERRRTRQLIAAAENAWLGGRPERALDLLERARPLASDPRERADIERWRGVIELNVGVPADAVAHLVRAAEDVASMDAERAHHLLTTAVLAAGYAGDEKAVSAIAEQAARLPPGDTALGRFFSLAVEGLGAHFARDFEHAAEAFRAALDEAETADATGAYDSGELLLFAGAAGLFIADDEAAWRFHQRFVRRARDKGAVSLFTQAMPRLALSEIAAGQWASANAGLHEGLELARQIGQHQVVAHCTALLARVAALRGNEDECRSLVRESRELASEHHLAHVLNAANWSLVVLELGRGRADEALAAAREVTHPASAAWAGLDRIEAAIRAGERKTAEAWLEPFSAWAAGGRAPWALAVVSHCRALLADNEEEAEALFSSALDDHREAARPFERARTELAFGEFLRRARRRVDAREHLRAALATFEALGAELWAERARLELRASGLTARRREPSTKSELTPQELQIARFVAEGLSNREVAAQLFLSPRTIDFHLRNVFRKLGITSRTQLARLDLGAPPDRVEEATSPAKSPVRA